MFYAGEMVETPMGIGRIDKAVVYPPYKKRFIIVNIRGVKHRFDSKTFDKWDIGCVSPYVEIKEPIYIGPRERLIELFDNLGDEKIEKLIEFLENL